MKYPSVKERTYSSRREKWHDIIFNADTREGKLFDVILLWAILLSVGTVMAESVESAQTKYGRWFTIIEFIFTLIFTLEYLARIYTSPQPKKYMLSFWGMIDLISTLPTYMGLFVRGPQFLFMLRTIRLLRVFRVLRLTTFMIEAQSLLNALKDSIAKIIVFFACVMIVVVVMGTVMYAIEPPEAGFTSIPISIYWAIVTLTTVGYGDITPVSTIGQFLSAALMILGYAIIAVPTGIVSVEMNNSRKRKICNGCNNALNEEHAKFCNQCGEVLEN